MKITRRQLRRLIMEVISDDKDFETVSDDEFAATSQAAYDRMAKGYHSDNPESIDSELARDRDFLHYETDAVYAELVDLLDDIAAPGWIRQNLEDGLTKDQIIAKAQRGEVRSREWMSTDSDGDDYPKTVGYTDPKGEKQMIVVNSLDDMNDILDLLADRDIPYSVD